MEITNEQIEKVQEIFMPYATRKRRELLKGSGRLVHYTTAENAMKILTSKSIWLRNAGVMHDYSEIQHGFEQIRDYLHKNEKVNRSRLYTALDSCSKGSGEDGTALFDQWWKHIQTGTYIGCFSEHLAEEDSHGRLSMWRAFGKNTAAVAIVMKFPDPYSALPLNVFLSPVAYFNADELRDEFDAVVSNIETHQDYLKRFPHQHIVGWVYSMLMMATVSLKHPGFLEEREWRLIHNPATNPSVHVPAITETIGGIPQIIHKVTLENRPDQQIRGIAIPELLDRVIIGPSEYSFAILTSLVKELKEAGIEDADSKVFISPIPLRG
ncbi:MAG: DUF2971 domain-containing protein [Methylophilaceae bacterium]